MAISADRLLWTKAAFIAAAYPISALAGKTAGELSDLPPLMELALRALKEAAAAARAAGHPLAYKPLERQLLKELRSMPRRPNPLLQNMRSGRLGEIDAVFKPFLQAARKKRLKTPVLESLRRFTRRLGRELRPRSA
jgi:ketopantoate reductase